MDNAEYLLNLVILILVSDVNEMFPGGMTRNAAICMTQVLPPSVTSVNYIPHISRHNFADLFGHIITATPLLCFRKKPMYIRYINTPRNSDLTADICVSCSGLSGWTTRRTWSRRTRPSRSTVSSSWFWRRAKCWPGKVTSTSTNWPSTMPSSQTPACTCVWGPTAWVTASAVPSSPCYQVRLLDVTPLLN